MARSIASPRDVGGRDIDGGGRETDAGAPVKALRGAVSLVDESVRPSPGIDERRGGGETAGNKVFDRVGGGALTGGRGLNDPDGGDEAPDSPRNTAISGMFSSLSDDGVDGVLTFRGGGATGGSLRF